MNSFEYPFLKNSLLISYTDQGVTEISWQKKSLKKRLNLTLAEKRIAKILDQFVSGEVDSREIPVDWKNMKGTDFQKKVWKKMSQIPFGKTKSYGQIAQSLKKPGAARAVGTACGKNPVLLAIPCHRVVGTQNLGGFSGGGLPVKRQLLAIEGHQQYL